MISKIVKITLLLVVFVTLAGISAYLTLTFLIKGEDTVVVPQLTGKKVVDVLKTLSDLGLNTKVGGSEYHDRVPLNHVVSQEPSPGMEIKKGRDVRIVISMGRRKIQVPDIIGMTLAQGLVVLEEKGLCGGVRSQTYSPVVKKDKIIAQSPAADIGISQGECVDLLVSSGERPRAYKMPDLNGLSLEDAILAIERHHMNFGDARSVYRKGKPLNSVIEQEPPAGSRVVEGTVVNLLANRRSGREEPVRLDIRRGVNLFRFKTDNGFIKSRIRVTLDWLGMSNDIFNGYMKPGKQFWFLIPRDNRVQVKVYQDDELIRSETYQN